MAMGTFGILFENWFTPHAVWSSILLNLGFPCSFTPCSNPKLGVIWKSSLYRASTSANVSGHVLHPFYHGCGPFILVRVKTFHAHDRWGFEVVEKFGFCCKACDSGTSASSISSRSCNRRMSSVFGFNPSFLAVQLALELALT